MEVLMSLEKTQENLTSCQICGKKYKNHNITAIHIAKSHKLTAKQYYDMFYKNDIEGVCQVCGKFTNYDSDDYEYRKCCSSQCARINPEYNEKRVQTFLRKYGVTNPTKLQSIRDKVKQTCLEKFGTENVFQNKSIKEKSSQTNLIKYNVKFISQSEIVKYKKIQTSLKHYGVEYPLQSLEMKQKSKNTNLEKYCVEYSSQHQSVKDKKKLVSMEKYGVECPLQSKIIKDKIEKTNIEKYGVKHNMQVKEIAEKVFKSALKSKSYVLPSGKIVYKMGYEPQFMNYVFQRDILKEEEIDYHPDGIKYIGLDGKEHYYFPDFYISRWNLIVEIKSTWMLQYDKSIHLKEEATRKLGYDYMRIINLDKNKTLDFTEFDVYCANKLKITV